MAGGSIKRHCFSEEDDVEPGYSGHNHFHHYQHGFISRTLGYGTFYNRRVRSHSIFSPRSGRFYDARFEDHQPHFLQACSLCKKPLGDNRDIFMYRGDTPFCSEECRQEQIERDEAKEKNKNLSSSMKALRKKERDHQPHFLQACSLCKKPLGDNRDIFMYRGDTPFCSEECRQEQIERDEAKEKNKNLSSSMKALRKKEQRNSVSPNKTQDYSFRAGTVAAA